MQYEPPRSPRRSISPNETSRSSSPVAGLSLYTTFGAVEGINDEYCAHLPASGIKAARDLKEDPNAASSSQPMARKPGVDGLTASKPTVPKSPVDIDDDWWPHLIASGIEAARRLKDNSSSHRMGKLEIGDSMIRRIENLKAQPEKKLTLRSTLAFLSGEVTLRLQAEQEKSTQTQFLRTAPTRCRLDSEITADEAVQYAQYVLERQDSQRGHAISFKTCSSCLEPRVSSAPFHDFVPPPFWLPHDTVPQFFTEFAQPPRCCGATICNACYLQGLSKNMSPFAQELPKARQWIRCPAEGCSQTLRFREQNHYEEILRNHGFTCPGKGRHEWPDAFAIEWRNALALEFQNAHKLRKRLSRLPTITEEVWPICADFHRRLMESDHMSKLSQVDLGRRPEVKHLTFTSADGSRKLKVPVFVGILRDREEPATIEDGRWSYYECDICLNTYIDWGDDTPEKTPDYNAPENEASAPPAYRYRASELYALASAYAAFEDDAAEEDDMPDGDAHFAEVKASFPDWHLPLDRVVTLVCTSAGRIRVCRTCVDEYINWHLVCRKSRIRCFGGCGRALGDEVVRRLASRQGWDRWTAHRGSQGTPAGFELKEMGH